MEPVHPAVELHPDELVALAVVDDHPAAKAPRPVSPHQPLELPAQLEVVKDEALRGCGFSWAKIAAIRDIAAKTLDGTVPTSRAIRALPDEEIIERLTAVRGVGRWTVEMLLIFTLGRGDVWPVDDFGVRSGYQWAYGLDGMPKPKELDALGEKFRPHRSHAAWYLWRATELAKVG